VEEGSISSWIDGDRLRDEKAQKEEDN